MVSRLCVRNLKIVTVIAFLFLFCTSSAFATPGDYSGSIVVSLSLDSQVQEQAAPAVNPQANSDNALGKSIASITPNSSATVTACGSESAEAVGTSSLADSILVSAYSLEGTPYSYGATGPRSFDCSGFVQYVYKANGITLPRIACDQANVGTTISKSDLMPGDLVFFGYYGSSSIHHVGIYLGNNQFIHASSGSGRVITSSLSSSYYASNYKWAKRVDQPVK